MAASLGETMPSAGSPEAEALRRFRSFAAAALQRGEAALPALDGIRVDERRATALLSSWIDAAVLAAGPDGESVRQALLPLLARFRSGLRSSEPARRASGTPRSSRRRAVSAAIDRIAEAFLAIDVDSGRIVDANPAAGSLLGTARDALLDAEFSRFVPASERDAWWTELDAVTESAEARRLHSRLLDREGEGVEIDASVTRFATRRRTLALVVARPAR